MVVLRPNEQKDKEVPMKKALVIGLSLLISISIGTTLFGRSLSNCWDVMWYDMEYPGEFGICIKRESFPFQFSKDWSDGKILNFPASFIYPQWRDDKVGFKAHCELYVPEAQTYSFTVAANNGFRLWIDDNLVLDSWQRLIGKKGWRTGRAKRELSIGFHKLALWYYEWDEAAEVSFKTTLTPFDLAGLSEEHEHCLTQLILLQERVQKLEEENKMLEEDKVTLQAEVSKLEKQTYELTTEVERLRSLLQSL
jgi:hypothetical protein